MDTKSKFNETTEEVRIIKTYSWENNGNSHGLKLMINDQKQFKFYAQTITALLEYQEIGTEDWLPYKYKYDPGICAIYGMCPHEILNNISRDLLQFCSDEYSSCHLVIKQFDKDVIWLKCQYTDYIDIKIFLPYISLFMVSESGYKDSYNKYDDQFHRLRLLSQNTKKTLMNQVPHSANFCMSKNRVSFVEKNAMYKWVLNESLSYFRPIIRNELDVILSHYMCRQLICIILDYVLV